MGRDQKIDDPTRDEQMTVAFANARGIRAGTTARDRARDEECSCSLST